MINHRLPAGCQLLKALSIFLCSLQQEGTQTASVPPHCDGKGTQIPIQSLPPLKGSQESLGSSTQTAFVWITAIVGIVDAREPGRAGNAGNSSTERSQGRRFQLNRAFDARSSLVLKPLGQIQDHFLPLKRPLPPDFRQPTTLLR